MAYNGPLPQVVKAGGTGDSSLTAYAVLTGGTASTAPIQSLASVGTSGQVLTSNGASVLPSFQSVFSPSGALIWSTNPGNITGVAGYGYFISTTTTITLPSSPNNGDTIAFINHTGSADITIQANTGQQIRIGPNASSVAGTAADTGADSLVLVYTSGITAWCALSVMGVWNLN